MLQGAGAQSHLLLPCIGFSCKMWSAQLLRLEGPCAVLIGCMQYLRLTDIPRIVNYPYLSLADGVLRNDVLQNRVEGAALLEAAELRGSDSDAELNDSDSDSDIDLGNPEGDSDQVSSEVAEPDSEFKLADGGDDAQTAAAAVAASDLEDDSEGDSELVAQDSEFDDSASATSSDEGGDAVASLSDSGSQHSADEQEEEDTPHTITSRKRKASSLAPASDLAESEHEDSDAEVLGRAGHSGDNFEEEAVSQEEDDEEQEPRQKRSNGKPKLKPAADSLQTLKRQLATAKGTKAEANGDNGQAGVPIEWGRVLTAEDFERIKELRHRYITLSNCATSQSGSCVSFACIALIPFQPHLRTRSVVTPHMMFADRHSHRFKWTCTVALSRALVALCLCLQNTMPH